MKLSFLSLAFVAFALTANAAEPSDLECGTDAILGSSANHNSGADDQALAGKYTVEDRIKNCVSLPGAVKKTESGVTWNLVARSRDDKAGKVHEVWQDSKTKLLWGDRLDSEYLFGEYTHYKAVDLGINGQVATETACASDEAKGPNGGIGEKKFGLPTIEEYAEAEKNGVRVALPNMKDNWFWSVSLNSDYVTSARGFDGNYGRLNSNFRTYEASVRCVGR